MRNAYTLKITPPDHPVYSRLEEKIYNTSDNVSLHYWIARDSLEGKQPIAFLHGLTGNHSGFIEYLEPLLAAGYWPILFDLRGHGKNNKLLDSNAFSIQRICQDIHEILTAEGISSLHMISHCYGSYVALFFHALYPDALQTLTLIEPFYLDHHTTCFRRKKSLLRPAAKPFMRGLARLPLRIPHLRHRYLYPYIYQDRNKPLPYFVIRDTLSNPIRLLQDAIRAVWESHEEFEHIIASFTPIPLLFIAGEKDTFVPQSYVENLYTLLKEKTPSQFVSFPKTGHTLPVKYPELLAERILMFIQSKE
ncbi:MAG TPA: alpha/beta hydrolase [bacterium]|nr:alpha/beta hydrolase [bacterium]